jgi:hypothetical protein
MFLPIPAPNQDLELTASSVPLRYGFQARLKRSVRPLSRATQSMLHSILETTRSINKTRIRGQS